MLATDLSDAVTSIAWLVLAISVLVLGPIAIRRFTRISAEMRGVKLTMDSVGKQVDTVVEQAVKSDAVLASIDMSVNHKLPHEPTMVRRLATVEDHVKALTSKFDLYAREDVEWKRLLVGVIGVDVRSANTEQTEAEREKT